MPEPATCKAAGGVSGNPILPATAEKYRSEQDYVDNGPGALTFARTYRSTWSTNTTRPASGLGQVWSHNHVFTLKATPATAPTAATVTTPEGYVRTFALPAGNSSWSATNSADTLTPAGTGWTYRRADDNTTFNFDAAGKLVTQVARNGWTTSYAYNPAGQVTSIINHVGRTLTLAYYAAGQLASVTTPDGRVIAYTYDASGRLSSVRYPDAKTRSFVYENASFPQALTGIYDELGARWGSFAYDTQGRAITTELAGSVERYQVSYPAAGSATVIDPLGTARSYGYGTAKGKLAVTSGSLPSGTDEADAASRVQDANGLVTSETDFKGVRSNTAWDVTRRLPVSVTSAVGTPDAKTTTTQWHPTFSLPVLVTEPGRTIASTYDALGNKLSETVTHTATSPIKTQSWNWTYNPAGLVATETAPNGAVTSYTYDALGNLIKTRNALGHETLASYDSANRVVSQTEPNGLVTSYAWDARDRLTRRNRGGQITDIGYTPSGQVATLQLPTGLRLTYAYDGAHRLTGWSNNRGESGSFTLDAMGNRVSEQIKDAGGAIAWQSVRSVNAINRLASQTEGASQSKSLTYDANGDLAKETNGLNQNTQYALDNRRRVKAITNAANATATLGYDGLDAVTAASDFKGVATSYGRDAQGNATTEGSADIGPRSTQYDALGLPQTIVDAMGQATQIHRDALGRPTVVTFADGKSTLLEYDGAAVGKGYLATLIDRSGSTVYQRDLFGRVVMKRQYLNSGQSASVFYAFNASTGLPESLTYPNDDVLGYQHDSTGRLTGLTWNGQPMLGGITWNALGQPTGWTWPFATAGVPGGVDQPTTRRYDTAGRLTRVDVLGTTFLNYQYDAAGRITNLMQFLAFPTTPGDPGTTLQSVPVGFGAGYDATGRLTSFSKAAGSATSVSSSTFGYDANGNRTTSSQTRGATTTSRNYTVTSGSNKLAGFSQTSGSASTSVALQYDANGDLTSDGLQRFSHDAEGRLASVSTGVGETGPVTRYAHNGLGQRVFKTEPLFPTPEQGGLLAAFTAFMRQLWEPGTSDAQKLGYMYMYDEAGNLIGEYGTGGAFSGGAAQYVYLPTASGPMPVVTDLGSVRLTVVADHLNTPRTLMLPNGLPAWQWRYSAFGEEQPTTIFNRFEELPASEGTLAFNLRYPGQYFDRESGLHYNYFRSYNPTTGRYTQRDPIGLDGGWNRFGYVNGNPLTLVDPLGLANSGAVGWMRGAGANASSSPTTLSIGAGGAGNWMAMMGSAESGLAIDTTGGMCFYTQVCAGAGINDLAGGTLGISGGVQSGALCSGIQESTGGYWAGGKGFAGEGQITTGADGTQLQRGLVGVGSMAGVGGMKCQARYVCLNR